MSGDIQFIVGKIYDLPPEKLDNLARQELAQAINQQYLKGVDVRTRQEAEERKLRRLNEDQWARKIEAYVRYHVRPGDLIKVKGARDGHGIRRVFRVIPDQGLRGHLQCFQLRALSNRKDRTQVQLVYEQHRAPGSEPYEVCGITEHFWDKVIGIVSENIDEYSPKYRSASIQWIRDIIRSQAKGNL